jgi:hypothetical protein
MAWEGHHYNIADAITSGDKYNAPNGIFLVFLDAYLKQKNSNTGLYQGSRYDIRDLTTIPPLKKTVRSRRD